MVYEKSSLGTLLTSLVIQGCGVITGILTARTLGPAARGELAAVMLWPVIFSNLALMGCNWSLAREVAQDPRHEADWARASAVVGGVFGCLYLGLGWLLVPWLLPGDKHQLAGLTTFCMLLIPLDLFNQMLLATEHGRMRWLRYNLIRSAFFLFYATLTCLVCLTHNREVAWFMGAFLASHFLAVLLRLGVQWSSLRAGHVQLARCWRLVKGGVPYYLATASNLLSLQLDKVLVVALMRTEAVGLYACAVTFSNAHSSLGEALGITSFAVLANQKDDAERARILSQAFRQTTLVSACLGGLLAACIPFLIGPLFGREFENAAAPAMVLTLGTSVAALSKLLNEGLKGAGRPYAGLLGQGLGTAVLAVVASLLCPAMGLMGMAWAAVAGAFTQVLVLVAAASTLLRLPLASFWALRPSEVRTLYLQLAALAK